MFPDGTVHRLALGTGALKVMVPAQTPDDSPRTEHFWDRAGLRYVTMWLDDLDSIVERWTAHGGTVALGPITIREGVRTALLVDPDGNTVEAMHDSAGGLISSVEQAAPRTDPAIGHAEDGVDHDADDQDHDHVRDEQRVVGRARGRSRRRTPERRLVGDDRPAARRPSGCATRTPSPA